MSKTANEQAFLAMIRSSEVKQGDPYTATFGYKFVIHDFADHPVSMGLWHGEPLDFLGPAYVGKKSTAAGAYQIVHPVWINLKGILRLPDFTPHSQDLAALELMNEVGARKLINLGQFDEAVKKCSKIWASLPGSTAGQPMTEFAKLKDTYDNWWRRSRLT